MNGGFWDLTYYNIFIYLEGLDHLYCEMSEETKYTTCSVTRLGKELAGHQSITA